MPRKGEKGRCDRAEIGGYQQKPDVLAVISHPDREIKKKKRKIEEVKRGNSEGKAALNIHLITLTGRLCSAKCSSKDF